MRLSTRITGVVAAALLFASFGWADSIKSDYDHGADFAQLHTYSWGDVKTSDPLYAGRIKDEVNRVLQAKGWQMVPNGGQATVFATGQVKNQQQLETMYNSFGPGWGGGWGWGGWGWGARAGFGEATTSTVNQPVADLVIDMFSANNKKLLWRGIIQRDVSNKAEKNTKSLDKDIDKLFKDFPPKGKS